MSALADIQQALYVRLATDPGLAVLGFKVYDEPPGERSEESYVALGEATEVRGGDQTTESHSHDSYEATETLHIWSRANSSLRAKEALAAVVEAVESSPLVVSGWGVVLVRYEFSTLMREPGWRHIPARFRIIVGTRSAV